MTSLDWSQCPAVESTPGKVSGAWVFRGTRLPVATVIENLEDLSVEEVMEQFDVTREQINAVLDFVAQSLQCQPEDLPNPISNGSGMLERILSHIDPGPAEDSELLVHLIYEQRRANTSTNTNTVIEK
jgi:uncharacterized protein (DUF433 family)